DYSARYHDMLAGIKAGLLNHGADLGAVTAKAQSVIYGMVQGQARMLAFVDDFRFLAAIFLAVIPLVFFLHRGTADGAGAAH
ncbi:MAG: hypothetical protein PVF40_09610, partial [Ectothiorhodospiraceae bacterium]